MSKANDLFKQECACRGFVDVLYEINLKNKYCDYFTIVEGSSDINFYSCSNIKILNNKKNWYIWLTSSESKGKEAVIDIYMRMKAQKTEKISKTIFIVDHDYYGLKSEKYYAINKETNNISITKYYAFENYFLEEENLKRIFDILGLPFEEYERFYNIYNSFVNEIREFNIYKSATVIACKLGYYNCQIGKTKIYDYEDIFNFNFDKIPVYDRIKLQEQVDKIKQQVSVVPKMREYCTLMSRSEYYGNIKYASRYTRGHDVFNFLEKYLAQKHNIKISYKDNRELYSKIVFALDIDIELKLGNGVKCENTKKEEILND